MIDQQIIDIRKEIISMRKEIYNCNLILIKLLKKRIGTSQEAKEVCNVTASYHAQIQELKECITQKQMKLKADRRVT